MTHVVTPTTIDQWPQVSAVNAAMLKLETEEVKGLFALCTYGEE
jgi:dihydrodipicolinate synthase/N-acetylneuraminate lyase